MKVLIHDGLTLQLKLVKDTIHIRNFDGSIQHSLDAHSTPHLVDYMEGNICYVQGYIEDGLLIIENRMPNLSWSTN